MATNDPKLQLQAAGSSRGETDTAHNAPASTIPPNHGNGSQDLPPAQNYSTPTPSAATSKPDVNMDKESDDEEEKISLNYDEKLRILKAMLITTKDPKEFQASVDKALPVPMKFNYLMKTLHPDTFQEEHKEEAKRAFQNLTSFRDNLGGDKHVYFYFGKGDNSPLEHTEGDLASYHKDTHQQATAHLKALFDALQTNPRLNPNPPFDGFDQETRAAIDALNSLNSKLKSDNQLLGKDLETGIIRFSDLSSKWRVWLMEPSLMGHQIEMTGHWCREFGYPEEWANPRQLTPLQAATEVPSSNSQPPLPTRHNVNSPALVNQGHPWRREIALPPRTLTRFIQPGFTSKGEQIFYIQRLGLNGARFVVQNSQGMLRLISCADAGGQRALHGALNTGVPTFLQDDGDIRQLRERVQGGGYYGLFFVAMTPWNPSEKNLPYTGVGFWHIDERRNLEKIEVALSRSALKKVLASTEAEKLIAESMPTQSSVGTLKEALYEIFPDVPRPNATLGLPSPQQQLALPQPYLSSPQQLQAQQVEQQIQQLQGQLQQLQFQQPQFQQPQSGLFGLQQPQQQQQSGLFGLQQPQQQQQSGLFGPQQHALFQ